MKHIFAIVLLLNSARVWAGPSLSDQVTLSVLPAHPIVILGRTVDSKGRVVEGPWFSNRINLRNESTQQVNILTVAYTIVSGSQTRTIVFNPPANDFVMTCPDGHKEQVRYTDFGRFLAGDSGTLRLQALGFPADCGDPLSSMLFLAGALPSMPNGKYEYTVEVRVIGWFGTWDNPTESLDKTFKFLTR